MKAFSVSPNSVQEALRGFTRQQTPEQFEIAGKIRDDDRQTGIALLGMLDLLQTDFGKWKYNPDRKKVEFDTAETLDKFVALRAQMEAIIRDEQRLQVKLVNLASN